MLKSYKYRLLPSDEQKQLLSNWFGACRFIYNLGLETKIAAWTSLKKNLSSYDLMKQLTELKNTECLWLKECPAQSLESALTHLDTAYAGFFKGKGFPRFKKKSGSQSIQFRRDSKIESGRIKLTKLDWVDFIEHRPIGNGEIRTVTLSKSPTGKYFVSVLVRDEIQLPSKESVKEKTTVGIDVGLKTFATLSDGQQYDNPKYLHKQLKRLRIEQRKLDRRYQKGVKFEDQSKGWRKQKLVVALLHEKIKNQREDFLHRTSTAIVKQYDTICLEDLNVSGMVQNRKLSKSISDVGWDKFNQFLKYKSEIRGKNIVIIGRFEPTSKTCSQCGYIYDGLNLSERDWACTECGQYHDRDVNAAINIKYLGLRQALQPLT